MALTDDSKKVVDDLKGQANRGYITTKAEARRVSNAVKLIIEDLKAERKIEIKLLGYIGYRNNILNSGGDKAKLLGVEKSINENSKKLLEIRDRLNSYSRDTQSLLNDLRAKNEITVGHAYALLTALEKEDTARGRAMRSDIRSKH